MTIFCGHFMLHILYTRDHDEMNYVSGILRGIFKLKIFG